MTRLLAATPQLDVPSWAIVVILLIAFAVLAAGCALVVLGFLWAAPAGRGEPGATARWVVVVLVEGTSTLVLRRAGSMAYPLAVIALQVLTYAAVRAQAAPRHPGGDGRPPPPDHRPPGAGADGG